MKNEQHSWSLLSGEGEAEGKFTEKMIFTKSGKKKIVVKHVSRTSSGTHPKNNKKMYK